MRHIEYVIPESFNGKKVLHFLRGEAKLSARLVNSLKRIENGITCNGQHIRTVDLLKKGDVLAVNLPEDKPSVEPIGFPLDIVYEDSDILVINKPAGLAMHPTHNHQGDTLANGVAAYFRDKGQSVTFRAVGRLDKGTSGLVLCALNKPAASKSAGHFHKTYYAVVGGVFRGSGTIDRPIYRPDPMKTLRAVGDEGDRAVTHWQSLWTDGKTSLLEIHLETGRTHQIRVHFASCGTPLCGDDMYGSSDTRINRAALHCGKLELIHPITEENLTFQVPFPADFAALLPETIKNSEIFSKKLSQTF